jgi:lysine 2,3-aminomutase
MNTPFVSKRAEIYKDVPDEKWNDWRWQLSHRMNSVEDIEKVLPLTDSERKALQTQGLFRVDVTPYFISLIDPNDPNDPTRKQVIPVAEEMQSFTSMMEDSLAEDKHSPVPGFVTLIEF